MPSDFEIWVSKSSLSSILDVFRQDSRPTFWFDCNVLIDSYKDISSITPSTTSKAITFTNVAFDAIDTTEILGTLQAEITRSKTSSNKSFTCTCRGFTIKVFSLVSDTIKDYRIAVLEKVSDVQEQVARDPRDLHGSWRGKENGIVSFFDVPTPFHNFRVETGKDWKRSLEDRFDKDYHDFITADWYLNYDVFN